MARKPRSIKNHKSPGSLGCLGLLVWLLIALVVLTVLGAGIRLVGDWRRVSVSVKENKNIPTASQSSKNNVSGDIVTRAGKHIVLPVGETPTIARITDVDTLIKDQPFYQGAKNGDFILIYKNTKTGYIYDPVNDIIVKVGPIYMRSDIITPSSTNIE